MDASYLALATAEAEKYVGATAPNPPVGACLVKNGKVLSVGAHERAGTPHAEIVALDRAVAHGHVGGLRGATLYVTLEPCNHQGRTPPCTQAIVAAGIARVVYGLADPNPEVRGGGARFLSEAGIETVSGSEAGIDLAACRDLLHPFVKRVTKGRPWLVHKLAYRLDAHGAPTMLPEPGQKTFTSEESLRLAHLERRKSDAILTSLDTILYDDPMFNVRLVSDHASRKRLIAIVSSSKREVPREWLARQHRLGFEIVRAPTVSQALDLIGELGALRVLAEVGPRLSRAIGDARLWDERLTIIARPGQADAVTREVACSPAS